MTFSKLRKGLVGYWTMDDKDTQNGVLGDRSGQDNHATINGATTGSSGMVGQSYSFDGADDSVVLDSPITLDRFGATLCFWVKPESSSTNYTFISSTDDYYNMIELETGRLKCETNTNQNRFNNSNYSIRSDWHHLAVVFDNERAYWYEDGESIGEATNYGTDGDGNSANKMVDDTIVDRIGYSVYENIYAGNVSDIRFYDRPLSDAEINMIYNIRNPRYGNL